MCATDQSMMPRCTGPIACVLVIPTGSESAPTSSSHAVPVISPLPLSECQPAATDCPTPVRPNGRTTVTPVRTGPEPRTNGPSPEISVS